MKIITVAIKIQSRAQNIAGIPEATAMFAASEWALVNAVMKKTFIKSKIALKRVWVAIRASRKSAHFLDKNLKANANNSDNIVPEIRVNAQE